MKNRIFFLLLFFVCLEWNAYAVIDIQSIHITSSDGLANNTIRDIFQEIRKALSGLVPLMD